MNSCLSALMLAYSTTFSLVSCKQPNIVFILADDLGFNDASIRGFNQIPTPNLDALAYSGTVLDRYYVNPICSPSRSALMTGKYPIHTGMQCGVIRGDEPYGLGLQEVLLPQLLSELGYTTHAIGKWHLGHFSANYTPTHRGFQSHRGYWLGKGDYLDHTERFGPLWGLDFRDGMSCITDALGNYSTRLFTDWAQTVIQQHNASKPLFLYVAHQAVHTGNKYANLEAPTDSVERFTWIRSRKRRTFAGMLHELDDSVGRVVEALRAREMLNNTIIVFSTDNGGPNGGVDGNVASNWPLRGVKYTLWEGGVRGAAFVWTSSMKSSRPPYRQLMHISDWLPTLYSAAGGNVSDLLKLDGVNQWPELSSSSTSAADSRSEVILNIDPTNNYSGIIVGRYKFIEGQPFPYNAWYGDGGRRNVSRLDLYQNMKKSSSGYALRELTVFPSRSQYIRHLRRLKVRCKKPMSALKTLDCSGGCLFDLIKDPCEFSDVSGHYPELTARLKAKLGSFNDTMVPCRNKPPDPRANPKYWDYKWVNWMDY